jgi:hypothetical protein
MTPPTPSDLAETRQQLADHLRRYASGFGELADYVLEQDDTDGPIRRLTEIRLDRLHPPQNLARLPTADADQLVANFDPHAANARALGDVLLDYVQAVE